MERQADLGEQYRVNNSKRQHDFQLHRGVQHLDQFAQCHAHLCHHFRGQCGHAHPSHHSRSRADPVLELLFPHFLLPWRRGKLLGQFQYKLEMER